MSRVSANQRMREKLSTLRSCGQCRACCTTMEVDELQKKAGVRCQHMQDPPAKGCATYETRPTGCRDWKCVWLAEPQTLNGDERPDRLGVIFDSKYSDVLGWPVVSCREVREGAFQELPVRVAIARLVGRTNLVLLISGSEGALVVHEACGPQDKLDAYESYEARRCG